MQAFLSALIICSGRLHCEVDLDSAMRQRSTWVLMHPKPQRDVKEELFQVEKELLVARGASLSKARNWAPYTPTFYGPCTIIRVKHPAYVLSSRHGRISFSTIHAQILVSYVRRSAVAENQSEVEQV